MDTYMIILRLIHIFSGIFWVGATFFVWGFVTPTVQSLGQDGAKFMLTLLNERPYIPAIIAANLLTVVSGLLMYYEVSDGFDADWMSLTSSTILSIGAVAGLAAAGHGAFVIGPTAMRIRDLGNAMTSAGGPPSQEQVAEMGQLQAKMSRNVNIIVVIMIVAVAGMASARYF